jgi:hypothetical protein
MWVVDVEVDVVLAVELALEVGCHSIDGNTHCRRPCNHHILEVRKLKSMSNRSFQRMCLGS